MSFILDALRKAESERHLGSVPALDARSLGPESDAAPLPETAAARPAGGLRWLAGGVGLGAVLVAAGAWWWTTAGGPSRAAAPAVAAGGPPGGSATSGASGVVGAAPAPAATPPATTARAPDATESPQRPATVAPAPSPSASPAPAPAPSATPAKTPTATASTRTREPVAGASAGPAPTPAPAGEPMPAPATRTARPAPTDRAGDPAGDRRGGDPAGDRRAGGDVPRARVERPVAEAPAAPRPVPSRESLAPDLRRGLPPLAVSGATYSNDPASRLLILDGQLVREGDRLGPDLVVEQIRPRSAVLSVRGERFSIAW